MEGRWASLRHAEQGLPLSIECREVTCRSDTIIMYNSYNRVRPPEVTPFQRYLHVPAPIYKCA
jgi:hypothetical protein